MKRLILTILALCICLSLGLMLISCEDTGNPDGSSVSTDTDTESGTENATDTDTGSDTGSATESDTVTETESGTDTTTQSEETTVGPEGISKEEWQDALAQNNFTNVTIYYTLKNTNGEQQDHVVKITPDKVYRKMTYSMGDEIGSSMDICLSGDEAKDTATLFVNVFLGLLAERDNFVYDFDTGVYNAPQEVTVTAVEEEGYVITESMKNGKVKFDRYGNLEYFTCDLTESISYGDGDGGHSGTFAASWTFADYNKTVITDEEAAAEDNGGPSAGPEDSTDVPLGIDEVAWNNAIREERFSNVTLSYSATFIEGYDQGHHEGAYLLDGYEMIANGEYVNDPAMVTTVRSFYLDTVMAMLLNFNQFTYDPEFNCFVSIEDITYTVDVEPYGTVNITVSDVYVTFDDTQSVHSITCNMIQSFVNEGEPTEYVLETQFTYSAYGTTAIDPASAETTDNDNSGEIVTGDLIDKDNA